MQVAGVDKGSLRAQPAKPHGYIAARLHKFRDPRVFGRPLLLPPQNFRTVIEAGTVSRRAQNPVAGLGLQTRDLRGATCVQPGVVRRDGAPIFAYANYTRHLSRNRHCADFSNPAPGEALTHNPTGRSELVFRVFLHAAGIEFRLGRFKRFGEAFAFRRIHRRLHTLRANVDPDQLHHAANASRDFNPLAAAIAAIAISASSTECVEVTRSSSRSAPSLTRASVA